MNHSVDNRSTGPTGPAFSAPLPLTGLPADTVALAAPVALPADQAVLSGDHAPPAMALVTLVDQDGKTPKGPLPLSALSGNDADRLQQLVKQLSDALGVPAKRIVVKASDTGVQVRTLPPSALAATVATLKDSLKSPWRDVAMTADDQAWLKPLLLANSSDRLDQLRPPATAAPVQTPGAAAGPTVITVSPITASAQTEQFIGDALKREIAQIADPLRQQIQSIELRYNDDQVLEARNRYTGATFEVKLPDDGYRQMRFQLIRQNPTPSLATLGGTRLLTEVQAGAQVMTGDGAAGSTFVEAAKVTYTSEKNWTFGAGVLTSQQLDGDNRQGASFRLGHNYWGVANVLITPDGQFRFRGLDTQAPREAWSWVKEGSTGRKIAVIGGVVTGAAVAVRQLGKSKKEMVFSNPLPELKLGRGKFQVVGGVHGKVYLGGSEDGKFALDGKLTGGTLRLRENGKAGVSNEQGVRYRRETMDDGALEHVLQTQVTGTNRLGKGYIHHSALVGYDLATKSLGQSMAGVQVSMPFGHSRELSWNAGANLGLSKERKVSYGDVRAGMMWQPSPAIRVFGSAGYVQGNHLIDPNLAGGLVGSMMPPVRRGEVSGPNQALNSVSGADKGRMAFTIGTYIRL
jgi:hypothetical protein